ncbi:MAG: hypothetical protein JST42_20650 [Bacteroidetes bacterium]|nr:hypothetical protein [Bacteroidota bacterium]
MNTLKNHILLYDSECPMCSLYSHAFTATGMLDTDGRTPYQQMPPIACPLVDHQRAVNEIALVNTSTGEVSYGIHSLFKIIAHSFPILPALIAHSILTPTLAALYFFSVTACMLLEHIRRTQLLGLGWTLSATWTSYHMVLLLLLLS